MTTFTRVILAIVFATTLPAFASAQVASPVATDESVVSTSKTEIYPLGSIASEKALEAIDTIFEGNPNVTASVDRTANNIVAIAPTNAHVTIRKVLDMLKRDDRSIAVISLKRIDPVAAKEVIDKLYETKGAEQPNARPVLMDFDAAQKVLLVQASQEELPKLRQLLAQLDQAPDPTSANTSSIRGSSTAGRRGSRGGRAQGGGARAGGNARAGGEQTGLGGGGGRGGISGLQTSPGIISTAIGTNQPFGNSIGTGIGTSSIGSGFSSYGTSYGTNAIGGVYSTFSGGLSATSKAPAAPSLLVTQPLAAQLRADWKEDLNIMDKLLRDAIGRVSGDLAMGIRVSTGDNIQPIYLEGFGAVFGYGVNMPLAAGEPDAKSGQPAAAAPPSAWERAKRELSGVTEPVPINDAVAATVRRLSEVKFNPAQLDTLLATLLRVLPEAKNFRYLKPEEFMMVTITGADDAGAPVRLTLKVKKSDIDDAAKGRLTPEEFKKRVTWHIG